MMNKLHLITLVFAASTAVTVAARAGEVEVDWIATSRDGDALIFEVSIEEPHDLGEQSVGRGQWRNRHLDFPQVAELRSSPAHLAPTYHAGGEPINNRTMLHFIGRTTVRDTLSMTLGYPTTDGAYVEHDVVLNFADADQMNTEPSPRKRWAEAQANWFGALARQTDDLGGFFTFAEQQTRRQFGLEAQTRNQRRGRGFRPATDQIYSITTGALAVQESLQLDRMLDVSRERGDRNIAIDTITPVTVKSHPFDEMRGDDTPRYSELAACVPETNYYARFQRIDQLLELLDFNDEWGASLLRLTSARGADSRTRERLEHQLCLPADSALVRLLGPHVVSELAITGSDLHVRDGSDVSILFRVSSPEVFKTAVDLHIQQALARDRVTRSTVEYAGTTIERIIGPGRRISCHRAWIDDLCIYSNSEAALRRIIDVSRDVEPALADAADFMYMRASVYPLDEADEDGFLYLSDEFIRHLVSPELRIKGLRRLEGATTMKMIANAALYHGYMNGPSEPDMGQLIASGSLHSDDLFAPSGGTYDWHPRRGMASSSVYNDLLFLTPLVERPITHVSEREKQQYETFRQQYQSYWRRFFDPIAMRFHVDDTVRIDTCILPLIDLSEYNEYQDLAGGEPVEMDLSMVPEQTLLRIQMKLNDGRQRRQALSMLSGMTGTNATADWVGDWITMWVEDTDALQPMVERAYGFNDPNEPRGNDEELLDIFNSSIVFGVHVKNKVSLATFLVAMRSLIDQMAPNTVIFNTMEPYKGVTLVQMAPHPEGMIGSEFDLEDGEDGPSLYYTTFGRGFYLATQQSALHHLIDRVKSADERPAPSEEDVITTNMLLYADVAAAEESRPIVSFVLEQQARRASVRNLAQVWMLGRCGILDRVDLARATQAYLGYRLVCPDGGQYRYDASTDAAISTVHGRLRAPTRLEAPPEGSPVRTLVSKLESMLAGLEFTEHGVTTRVEIRRRPAK